MPRGVQGVDDGIGKTTPAGALLVDLLRNEGQAKFESSDESSDTTGALLQALTGLLSLEGEALTTTPDGSRLRTVFHVVRP